ncbi:hypothetical protein RN51_00100 [Microbacterium oxydans]|uniref:Uncharacterized protein n=1 Tax=Microbacterium oxydans TaxID=82380 RepID=A0A0F0L2C5_9MICO|nr:hypothetical protein [Microbacterium oxydans]KJL26839.1 hypothetical protein RN51_00100 [Microbacterium oxydans]
MVRIREAAIPAVITVVLLSGCTSTIDVPVQPEPMDAHEVVLTVDGTDVDIAGLQHCALRERASVYDVVMREYGVPDGPGFWTTEVGETTPSALLLDRAVARCAADTVRRDRAVRLGAIDDPSFDALLARLEARNADRERRHEAGEVLYGPVEYTLVDFESKEFADFATIEEKAAAESLRGDVARVDAFIATRPDLQAEPDAERARAIAVQMMARDLVDSEISQAVTSAEVVPDLDWFANVDVTDLLAETTESSG